MTQDSLRQDTQANNKRIAKNTLLLYFRMLLLMLISLYTSRVILNALGVEDYGIYNVVGGVVAMFSLFSGSFSSSVSRFLTFELGKKDIERLKLVFSTSVIIQVSIAMFIIIIAEIAGIWFLNNKMNLPPDRLGAANWVMHCSIITFAVNLVSIPYNAAIIAHEKMSAFAYVGILEAILKLVIAFLIYNTTIDRLKLYAVLIFSLSLIIRIVYGVYCKKHFVESSFVFSIDKPMIKEMTSFAGWTLLGSGAYMFNTQGVNILLNMFFGVTLNAARGIATQVENVVTQFVNNFMIALNPQITKSYAEGNLDYMHTLVYRGAKYSYFLMLYFAVPICIETEQILTLWLKIVPNYAVDFVRLTFVTTMCTLIGNTLITSQQATGKIKKYQIVVTIWGMWVFPLTWLTFKFGCSPVSAYVIYAFIYFVLIFIRIYLVKDLIRMPWQVYIKSVLLKCAIVSVLSIILPYCICKYQEPSFARLFIVVFVSLLSITGCVLCVGLESKERLFVFNQIRKKNT